MRTTARASVLMLAILAIALAVPADAACKYLYSDIETTWFPAGQVELGWAAGFLEGGVYFKYDDAAPPVDPFIDPPNLILSSKAGDVNFWVAGESYFEDGVMWRKLNVLNALGTGIYANAKISGGFFGKCVAEVGGNYTFEGTICTSALTTKR